MPRRRDVDSFIETLFETLTSRERSAEEKMAALQAARATLPANALDEALLTRIVTYNHGLRKARAAQEQLKALLERAMAEPWHVAVFLSSERTPTGVYAFVAYGSDHRLVAVADAVSLAELGAGDLVFLNDHLNVLVYRAPATLRCTRDTGFFARALADGRLVIKVRDEEVIVHPAAALATVELAEGDQLSWARNAGIAFEKIAPPVDRRYRVTERPTLGRADIGAQDDNVKALLSLLTLGLVYPDKARSYGLEGKPQNVLLVGPPGNGKTLLARIAAAELGVRLGVDAQFFVVKPAEWESPWVGETERNVRQCFAMLLEASKTGPVVLFLDEVEGIGRARGSAAGQHADRALAALLAELDGFAGHANVVVISATNRKDLLDPALRERLSEVEMQVRRPARSGATRILEIHLPEKLPCAADTDRRALVAAVISRLYAPNADNGLCKLRFRDGTERTVLAPELMSGRLLQQICKDACRSAANRDCDGGAQGVQAADIEGAAERAMERLATTLTAANARMYLADLPQDVDVVSVQPILRRVHPRRYRTAA